MEIRLETATWKLRVRFKMFRTTNNTGGRFQVGLLQVDSPPIPGSNTDYAFGLTVAGAMEVNVADYAAGSWHDIELFFKATSYVSASTYVAGGFYMTASNPITGDDIWISDFNVDENYGVGPGLPQVTAGAAYTLKMEDNGRHIYISTGGVTIPNNSAVPFEVETFVTVINNSGSTQTISKGGSVTLIKATSGSVASLTLAAWGKCELVKVDTDTWHATGNI